MGSALSVGGVGGDEDGDADVVVVGKQPIDFSDTSALRRTEAIFRIVASSIFFDFSVLK